MDKKPAEKYLGKYEYDCINGKYVPPMVITESCTLDKKHYGTIIIESGHVIVNFSCSGTFKVLNGASAEVNGNVSGSVINDGDILVNGNCTGSVINNKTMRCTKNCHGSVINNGEFHCEGQIHGAFISKGSIRIGKK